MAGQNTDAVAARAGGRAYFLASPSLLLVVCIIVLPSLQLIRYSFNHFDPSDLMQAAWTWENYKAFFTQAYYLAVLGTTLKIALLCTVLSFVFGFPAAYILAKSRSRYKSLLVMLLLFPLLVGTVVRAAGWMIILGNAGFINSVLQTLGLVHAPVRLLYTPLAVVVGTTAVVLPFMIITLQSVLEGLDFSVEEAARNLGATFWQSLWRVIFPLAMPGIAAGNILVFILCMNAYATPVLLGGTRVTMMAPAVYDQISKVYNWPFGSVIALILMLVTFLAAGIANAIAQRNYQRTMQG